MVTGLEPSLLRFIAKYDTLDAFVHSIPSCCSQSLQVYNNHYPSLRIVIEYPQLLAYTFPKNFIGYSVLHVNPLNCDFFNHIFINGLPTCLGHPSVSYKRPSYSFASTISTCCSHGLGTMNATLLPTIYHVSVGAPSS